MNSRRLVFLLLFPYHGNTDSNYRVSYLLQVLDQNRC